MKTIVVGALLVLSAVAASAQEPRAADSSRATQTRDIPEKTTSVTHHQIKLNGSALRYTATTGMLPIRNATSGVVEGNMFYVYYSKDGENPATRPISFIFNGGPGSSSVWLHMGAWGPRIVRLNADGTNPPPPYTLQDNQHTLLDKTDLVFIDPVGTGYSRATKAEFGPNFWGLDEDMRSVGEFIRLFLVRNQRWASPKYIGGESYGTTRAAHLSAWMHDNGIALNGVLLISAILNFQTARQSYSNDLGWIGYFPTYTATAWYHRRLPPDLQSQSLEAVLEQAERWVDSKYLLALHAGDRLTPAARAQVVEEMARFTGLSRDFIDRNDLRITLPRFNQELLRDQRRTVGRLDSRFTTFAVDPGAESGAFDPSEASIRNSFTTIFNDYVRRSLAYNNDEQYYILGGGIGTWKWPQQGQGFPDVTPSLERAYAKNPALRVYVAFGYYDAATPYWAVEYTLAHLRIAPEAKRAIVKEYFPAGHMMYIEESSMAKMSRGLRAFIAGGPVTATQ